MMRQPVGTLVLAVLLTSSVLGQGNSAWVSWARDHHRPIASLTSPAEDDFADLAFLKDVLGTRRLVQLGESGHGVAQFKVLGSVGPTALFVDFLQATPTEGNAWIFERTLHCEWGTNAFEIVPRDQYDGVILIDVVSSPRYL